jgi:hypothetical protein
MATRAAAPAVLVGAQLIDPGDAGAEGIGLRHRERREEQNRCDYEHRFLHIRLRPPDM